MAKKFFVDLRLWGFLVAGLIIIYCGLSFIICGRLVLEIPNFSNKINIPNEQLFSGLKDFERDGNSITSKSTDPWIEINFKKTQSIKGIKIELSNLSIETTRAQIYYADENSSFTGERHYDLTLKKGDNSVLITNDSRIKTLRLDLTDTSEVSLTVSNITILLQKNVLLFWTIFVLAALLYCLTIFKSYLHNQKKFTRTQKYNSEFHKELLEFNKKRELLLLGSSFIISILCYLPYLTNTLYSIDDYYLNQLYDLNISTLGYNFHSTGRYLESVLAQIFYYMNIQPLTKPLGPILFIGSLSILGVYFSRMLKIESFKISLCFVLIFTTNPFLAEIFQYSIIPAYSAFAIITLALGVIFGELFTQHRKLHLLIISVLSYVSSLTIYQIFFPVVFLVFIYQLLVPIGKKNAESEHRNFHYSILFPLAIYLSSFIVYTILLKITFFIWPPTLAYSGSSITELAHNIVSPEYWSKIFTNMDIYMLNDNSFNSGKINTILGVFFTGTLILHVSKQGATNQVPIKRLLRTLIIYMFIAFLGLFVNLGFSLLRPAEISSRSFTAFGIYQGILILLTFELLKKMNTKSSVKKISIILISMLVLFGNSGRIGRLALDQYRLNTLEKSLVTRIVSRLEINNNFSPSARLVIIGGPSIGNLQQTTWADYNIPAIRQFSKVFLFNEISGYNFQMPTEEDVNKANEYLDGMDVWPNSNSIKYIEGMFIIKLS